MDKQESEIPSNANEGCVGPSSDSAGHASACQGCPNASLCQSGAGKQAEADPAQAAIDASLAKIKHVIPVLSGKGGVGKSTFASQLAFGLARRGLRVGLLDVDLCGPSIPMMLGLRHQEVHQSSSGWSPVFVPVECDQDNDDFNQLEPELGVMSIGFLIPDESSAVIWRGPRKNGLIQQFLGSVDWGELDYLVIDTPPGTSDEHISIVQMLKKAIGEEKDGAIVVTTPQEVSMLDVKKELNFTQQTKMRVLGVVENMSTMKIPIDNDIGMTWKDNDGNDKSQEVMKVLREKCPEILKFHIELDVFKGSETSGTPAQMAAHFNVPFLGSVPLDQKLQKACEDGDPSSVLHDSASSGPIREIVSKVLSSTGGDKDLEMRKVEFKQSEQDNATGVISIQTAT